MNIILDCETFSETEINDSFVIDETFTIEEKKNRESIRELKKNILRAAYEAQEGHIASTFSIIDILWVLYHKIMKYDSRNPFSENRDRFILSKGHASLALYTILADCGFFPKEELMSFCKSTSRLGGHPDRKKVPGVEASTGSLGHGFPIAVGIALALKIQKKSSHVFSLIGDGECNEGTIWESALVAAHQKLDNLTVIVDYNHSTDRALNMGSIVEKFRAFGWNSFSINGHDLGEISHSLLVKNSNRPTAIIAETIKGHGCAIMQNNPEWHHKAPTKSELEMMLETLS